MNIFEEMSFYGNLDFFSAQPAEIPVCLEAEPEATVEEDYTDDELDVDEVEKRMWRDRMLLRKLKEQNKSKDATGSAKHRQLQEQARSKNASQPMPSTSFMDQNPSLNPGPGLPEDAQKRISELMSVYDADQNNSMDGANFKHDDNRRLHHLEQPQLHTQQQQQQHEPQQTFQFNLDDNLYGQRPLFGRNLPEEMNVSFNNSIFLTSGFQFDQTNVFDSQFNTKIRNSTMTKMRSS
ncbi:unnamed protein product [Rhodiola kirilowii]